MKPNDTPIHSVTLATFWLDQTEVTIAQYARCSAAGQCQPVISNTVEIANTPVSNISWQMAHDYCAWIGGRLPTEAEWEYAAQGPERRPYPWGYALPDGTQLNFCDKNCGEVWAVTEADDGYAAAAPVAMFPTGASWCGALDLAGNVWEWTNDWYGETYYALEPDPVQNPPGPSTGTARVLRGGSWRSDLATFYVSYRHWAPPTASAADWGFRCVVH